MTVHPVIHNDEDNVKCSTEVKGRKIKNPLLLRYAEQLSSNRSSNSLPFSYSIALLA